MKATALALSALLAGCAPIAPPQNDTPPLGPGEIRSALTAREALALGKSTKADVRAALGEPVAVDFASGYEVWVYKERLPAKTPPPPTELVLLFDPSGVLAKTRIR